MSDLCVLLFVEEDGIRMKACVFDTRSEFKMNTEFAASAQRLEQEITEETKLSTSRKRQRSKVRIENIQSVCITICF